MKWMLISILALFMASCSGSKSESGTPATNESKAEVKVTDTTATENSLNEIAIRLSKKEIDLREAGRLAGDALSKTQTSDLANFNYEKSNELYSAFNQSLKGQFKTQADGALIFIANALKIDSLEGFEQLSRTEKEKAILIRVGALREKSYLELEFFLASYFLNNKIFESLEAGTEDTKDQDLTFCKGHLIKFVKDTYAKNARYADAFSKYAIWGEILSDCNLASIYLPSLGSIAINPNDVKAEHVIIANVLRSEEIKKKSWATLRYDRKAPAIIKTLIAHSLFAARALGNSDQILFNLRSINNALIQLDAIISQATGGEDELLSNLVDSLWYDLHLPLRNALLDKKEILSAVLKERDFKFHPVLESIAIEATGNSQKVAISNPLSSPGNSLLIEKWTLLKDSLLLKAHIANLTQQPSIDEETLHAVKRRLDANILRAKKLSEKLVHGSESADPLYQAIDQKLNNVQYVKAGDIARLEDLNLNSGLIVVNALAKVASSQSGNTLDLANVKTGYFDFTPVNTNFTTPPMTPFTQEWPAHNLASIQQIVVNYPTGLGCAKKSVCDPERPVTCDRQRCIEWTAYYMRLSTSALARPAQPAKAVRGLPGVSVNVQSSSTITRPDIIISVNGEDGKTGAQGTDSKFCQNGIYNKFYQFKNGEYLATQPNQMQLPYGLSVIGATAYDSEAGMSGEGGNGGNGGAISITQKKNGISLMALGGQGGSPGKEANCNIDFDKSRNPGARTNVHLIRGAQGAKGASGRITEVRQ